MSFENNHNRVYSRSYQSLQIASMMTWMAPSILFSAKSDGAHRHHPPGDEEFLRLQQQESSSSAGIVIFAAVAAVAILGAAVSLFQH